MASNANKVCDFQLAPGQTTGDVAAYAHSHDDAGASGGHSHSHGGGGGGGGEHGHTHEIMESAGKFADRDVPNFSSRNWQERAFTVGIGG